MTEIASIMLTAIRISYRVSDRCSYFVFVCFRVICLSKSSLDLLVQQNIYEFLSRDKQIMNDSPSRFKTFDKE